MAWTNPLIRNMNMMGLPTKKQRLSGGTPLKHFLRPLIEEEMAKKMGEMQQVAQPMIAQQPSINPLQGALMGMKGAV